MLSKKLLLVFVGIFFMSSVYALGCCFDSSTGTCSPNSEQETCNGGNFFQDATCQSVSECNYGCCQIGTSVLYTREVTCINRAQTSGVEPNWFAGTAEQCTAAQTNNKPGACVIKNKYSTSCTYTTKESCGSGSFYENQLCSTPTLNTTCVKTENTTCFGEAVHYLDTCGNPDAVKQQCSYDSGSVCQKQDSNNAICKDLNCKNPLTGATIPNGQRWCVNAAGEGNVLVPKEFSAITAEVIFSRFTEKVVVDGKLGTISESGLFLRDKNEFNFPTTGQAITGFSVTTFHTNEQCAEMNAQKGEEEKGYFCEADVEEGTTVVYDPYTCEVCTQSLDACGENLCERCRNDLGGYSHPGRLDGCVSDNSCKGESVAAPVGSRFFSQYCLNGDIINEPCDDFRMGFCDDAKTGGKCEINSWDSCLMGTVESSQEGATSITTQQKMESCDQEFCKFLNPGEGSESETGKMISDLNLAMCVPQIAGGLEFYAKKSYDETSACSLGSYSSSVYLYSDGSSNGDWYIKYEDGNTGENEYGNLGILDICPEEVGSLNGNKRKIAEKEEGNILNPLSSVGSPFYEMRIAPARLTKRIVVRPEVIGALTSRCQAIADCSGKGNWIGENGAKTFSGTIGSNSEGEMTIPCSAGYDSSTDKTYLKCNLNFVCSDWKAPAGSESCDMCGADNLPCSQYRCSSLGKSCEYFEPLGADKGFCMSSADNTGPTITSSVSPNPVPPFSSVTINISTNEVSYCKFNVGNAGSTINDMAYDIDTTWSTNHQVILNVPGKIDNDDESSEYGLINRDGDYHVYVRCEDAAGNSNPTATDVKFQVMQTPDEIPTVIQNLTPRNNSFVVFNSTQQFVTLKLNEPAECRWSNSSADEFAGMVNAFDCDLGVSDYGVLNGYFCTGTLTDLNLTLGQQTNYFISCKDQPWLEGKEDGYYHRNTNPKSFVYSLKPSSQLTIAPISPSGSLMVGPANSNFTIIATTQGGAEAGKARCSWRLVYENITTAYYPFATTNSSTHTQVITNKSEANYQIQVKCFDIAGNIVEANSSLSLRVDSLSPTIARIFNDKGLLKLFTNEPAICKFKFATSTVSDAIGCLFTMNDANVTSLIGPTNTQHTTSWKKGFTYLVKCQDFFGNTNSGCGLIARAEK